MTLKETVALACTRATPENIGQVWIARYALVGIATLVVLMAMAIVLLIGPRP
jgi:hypothetical protein